MPPEQSPVELEAIAENGIQTNELLGGIEKTNEVSALKLDEIEKNTEATALATAQLQEPIEKMASSLDSYVEQNKEPISKMASFLSEMKGDKGDKGEKGDKGDKGDKGEKGDKGADSVVPGPAGKDGLNGKDGKNGKDGRDGKDGVNGRDGKDGAKGERGEKGDKGDSLTPDEVTALVKRAEDSLRPALMAAIRTSAKTVSLKELDDVDLSGLTVTNGKYVLGSGTGGGGAVDSVNGQTGVVVLDASDVGAYTEAEVDTLLGGKANSSHTHVIADTTGLQTALDGKAAVSHTHTSSQVTDFDTEVSNNTDVAANTAARHAAVTVTDSAEINFTLTGQDITANIIAGSIDETKLDASVNASLDLADSAVQPGDPLTDLSGDLPFSQIAQIATTRILGRETAGTGDIESLTAAQARNVIGLDTDDSPHFTAVNIGHATDTTVTRVSAGVIAVEGVTILRTSDVDDVPVNGATTDPISSNWAFDHEADTSTHGVTGAIVGTTDTQTLTNKTLTSDTNKLRYSKTLVVEDPTSAEDISFFFSNRAITVTEMRAVLVGSATPSVTWTIRHGTDRSAAGAEVVTSGTTTTGTTSGSDVVSFNDATVVADSFVWLETTAKSGTVDEIQVTIFYTED